jgi:hypothetical protein
MGLLDDAIREHLELKRRHGASEEDIQRAEQEALAPARRDPTAGAGVPPVEQVPPPPPPPDDASTELFDHEFPEPRGDVPPPPPPVDEPPPDDEPVYADEYELEPPPADPDAPEPALPPRAYQDEDDDDYLAPEPADDLNPQPLPPEDQETQIRSVVEQPGAEPAPDPEVPAGPEEAPPPGTAKPHGDPALDDDDFEPDEVPADEQLGGGGRGGRDPYRARTTILDEPLGDEPPGLADEPPAPGDVEPPPPAAAEPPPAGDEQDVLEETPDFLQETPEHDKLWFEQKPPRDFDFE